MKRINDTQFQAFRSRVEQHRRMNGYYIIDVVSISEMREAGLSDEEIMDALTDLWDDEPADREFSVPSNQMWADYRVEFAEARTHTIEALVGGRDVGHTRDTLPDGVAGECFDQFLALFDDMPKLYIRLGIGNSQYVFNRGVVAVGESKAGILWVVEGD